MTIIFEVLDKSGRKIRLTTERWKHIQEEHPNVTPIEELKEVLTSPFIITPSIYDPEQVRYYYRYNKNSKRYVFIAVKYLNGDGFIITAYHTRDIR